MATPSRRDVRTGLEAIVASGGDQTDRVLAAALLVLLRDAEGVEQKLRQIEDTVQRIKSRQ